MENKTHELYLFTQTPVHIGGEQEKHLQQGLDYVRKGNAIWQLDTRKMAQAYGLDAYVNALDNGNSGITNLLSNRNVDIQEVAVELGEVAGSCNEIKMMVRDGLYGQPYLPGTSLKGGLRSALFKAAGGREGNSSDREVFGEFDNSVMRFVNVSDVYFYHPGKLYNSGTYNPVSSGKEWEGNWKHAGGPGKNQVGFSDRAAGYNAALQTIPPGNIAPLRISLKHQLLETYQAVAKRNTGSKPNPVPARAALLLKSEDSLADLFQVIHEYTAAYLTSEIAYFEKLRGELTDQIIAKLKWLYGRNLPSAPILRLGFGSGFHAVTGDFQYTDHLGPLNGWNENKKRKSRRIAFGPGKNERFQLYPLGFVQLLRPEDAQPYLARLRQPPVFEPPTQTEPGHPALSTSPAPAAAPKDGSGQTADAPVAPEATTPDAVKPNWAIKTTKQLKKPVSIDGLVVGQEGTSLQVQPYLREYENTIILLRYPAGLPNGTVISLTVSLQGNKLVGQGAPRIK
jgi:hypothetical protein